MKRYVFTGIIMLFAGLFAYGVGQEKKQENLFNPDLVKVGDIISGLKISYFKKIESEDEKIYEIHFKGKKILSGKYEYNDKNDQFWPDSYAFYPDENSIKLLPVMNFDQRMVWFIFSNPRKDEILKKLKGKTGKVTLEIQDFQIFYYPSELANKAFLIQMIKQ